MASSLFRTTSSFLDLESGSTNLIFTNSTDPAEYAFLPREHRVLEVVRHWTTGVLPWAAIFLFLIGFIPFSHLLFLLLSLLCILACLRTLALTALVQRIHYLQSQANPSSPEANGGPQTPTQQPSSLFMLDTLGASLLNLRLSLLDRDFTPADYEALLGLDMTRIRVPVTDAHIARLRHYKHKSDGKASGSSSVDDDAPLCSVCLEQYRDGSGVIELPCKHTFHNSCISTWIKQQGLHATCPICKQKIFSERVAHPPTDQMRIS